MPVAADIVTLGVYKFQILSHILFVSRCQMNCQLYKVCREGPRKSEVLLVNVKVTASV